MADDSASPIVEQAAPLVEATSEVVSMLERFLQFEGASPMLRLAIAGGLVAMSLLLMLLFRLLTRRRIQRLEAIPEGRFRPLRWQSQDLVSAEDMRTFWLGLWRSAGWLLSLGCFVGVVIGLLMSNEVTLNLAARLIGFFASILYFLWSGFVGYLPNLFIIIVIVSIGRLVLKLIAAIFEGIKSRRIFLKNFYPEWADTSYGIVRLMIIALLAVIIFPYLPGSSSPAFQGISIFVGVLVSLGSTTAVANIIAGIVLTYTRAFQEGDQVEVSDTRGRVVERSTFVTRIQTLKNVIVSIPNSMVLNNNIINYSKNLGRSGLLVHTKITIGYDVPWQQVNDLLIAAARDTAEIEPEPEPFVLQTSLDDNYVSYEINGWTRKPEELPRIYSQLHANILDQFHGHQVEITSPAYRANRDGSAITIPEPKSEG